MIGIVMQYFELENEDSISQIIDVYLHECYEIPPLFHGTDTSLIDMPVSERKNINDSCEYIIKSLLRLYEKNKITITDKRLASSRDNHGNSATAYVFAKARMNNSSLYSYGDFYVTNDPLRAIEYSSQSWIYGETGWVANRLVLGADSVGIDLPGDELFIESMRVLNSRKKLKKNPAVLMILGCNKEELYNEKGEHINSDTEKLVFYTDVLRRRSSTLSFRLKDLNNVEENKAYIISEKSFDSLVRVWKKTNPSI